MKVLLDTNILLRIGEPAHPHHAAALSALRTLATAGHAFSISSQSVSEFLAVATRPVADRGLGMDGITADAQLSKVTSALEVLYETRAVVDELRRLVLLHGVSGKSVHDTKLVASMSANAITYLLTLNSRDFVRFTEIQVLDPRNLKLPP